VFTDGSFTTKHATGIVRPETRDEGIRYRWLGETESGSRGAEEERVVATRYAGVQATLYARGEAVGMNLTSGLGSRGGTMYLGKDVLGSVRSVSGEYGTVEERYEYDAFGKPYQGDLENGMNLGYTGKPYDAATGLYNYGYRDYKAEAARFTTLDPVRDGNNWFAYVNNDPVNWIDPWGLSPSDQKVVVASSQVGADTKGQQQFADTVNSGINTNTLVEGIYDTVVGAGKVIGGAGIIVASGAGEFLSGGTATPIAIEGLIYGGITAVDGWVQASVGVAEIAGALSNASTTNIPKSMSEILGIAGDAIINAVTGHKSATLQNLGKWVGSQPVGVFDLLLINTSPIN
jgi:RHS repeat-associated protein